MILSSFNWDTLEYDYYESNGTKQDIGGWDELQGLGVSYSENSSGVGIDIEDALPDLPNDAKFIGTGKDAVGRVVKPSHKLSYVPSKSVRRSRNNINSLKGNELVQANAPKSNYDNRESLPIVFFAIPLIAGLALGYRAGASDDNKNDKMWGKLLGAMGAVAVGVAIGREYESFKRKRG